MLAQHRPQRRLRKLAGSHQEVHHLNDGLLRVDDTEVHYGIDSDRDVVTRNNILFRHVQHADAEIHPHHLLDDGYYDDEPWTLNLPKAPQKEDHAPLGLTQNLNSK